MNAPKDKSKQNESTKEPFTKKEVKEMEKMLEEKLKGKVINK